MLALATPANVALVASVVIGLVAVLFFVLKAISEHKKVDEAGADAKLLATTAYRQTLLVLGAIGGVVAISTRE